MKIENRAALVVVLIAASVSSGCSGGIDLAGCRLGDTWATVDDYQPGSHLPQSASASSIAVDAQGKVYVTGLEMVSSSAGRMLMRSSSNAGATWTSSSSYEYQNGKNANSRGVIGLSNGRILMGGMAEDSGSTDYKWITVFSDDGGATWQLGDAYQVTAPRVSALTAYAGDPSGNIYAVGYGYDTSSKNQWAVRKSADNGATWTTSEVYQPTAAQNASPSSIIYSSSLSTPLVAGNAYISGSTHWLVRKLEGETWSNLDDYQYVSGQSSSALDILEQSDGTLWAAGYGRDAAGKNHWIVRKRATGSTEWTVMDDYQYVAETNAAAMAIEVSNEGDVYVVGYGTEGTATRAVVRRLRAGATQWDTVDVFKPYESYDTYFPGIAKDPTGNLYIAGEAYQDALGTNVHWFVRKLACR